MVQLGDLIDGQNAGKYGAGLQFAEPQSEAALARVVTALAACKVPMFHAIGNHELYNFNWGEIAERLHQPTAGAARGHDWRIARCTEHLRQRFSETDAQSFYYSWRPAEGWTFLMLNSYAVSMEQDPRSEGYREACEVLQRRNPVCYEALRSGQSGVNVCACSLERLAPSTVMWLCCLAVCSRATDGAPGER